MIHPGHLDPDHYHDGEIIRAGDRVHYNIQRGTVAFVSSTNDYLPEYPKGEWSDCEGIMIICDNGARLLLPEADEHFGRESEIAEPGDRA